MGSGALASINAAKKWRKENYAKYKARIDAYSKRYYKKKGNANKNARYHYMKNSMLNAIHTSDPESLFYEEP